MADETTTPATTGGLSDLLSRLVPEDETTIRDFLGRSYRVRTILPARRQVEAARAIQRLLARPSVVEALGSAAVGLGSTAEGAGPTGMAGALVAALRTAADPEAVDGIAEAFGAAYPSTLAEARESARLRGEPTADRLDAGDLFPLEEALAALLPLLVRPAARALALLVRAGSGEA